MKCDKKGLLLYAVTDRSWLNGETLYSQVEKALQGGATFIQLREKNLDQDHFMEEALELKKLCAAYHVPFVINDNVEIAAKMDADGVHVGQSDMEAGDVRAKLGRTRSSAFRHRPWNRPFSPSSAGQITSASAQSSTPVPRRMRRMSATKR